MADSAPDIKAIFLEALDHRAPAERSSYLDRACAGAPEVRGRVEALLAAIDQAGNFLEQPALTRGPVPVPVPVPEPDRGADGTEGTSESGRTGAAPVDEPTVPDDRAIAAGPAGPEDGSAATIGPYALLQKIGEGGMGTVYLAEQSHPIRRRVALKLIRPGIDSRTVLGRFEVERQALALMDHPNIARVLDAGTASDGRPFFVMELVKGVPITDYCNECRLGLADRLGLVRQVCSAVQHAHQKGVIHRDLKPSNILVESHDGTPVPKVIDFGLAKATGSAAIDDRGAITAFGAIAGTPMYMAPEQATFNAIDVDTRADIYALGVVLYELLTGSTPIRREELDRASLEAVLHAVRAVEPPTPSSRVGSSEAIASIAAVRGVDPSRLGRQLRGDLDWVVMKALSKERQRRYESAAALSLDLERFLHHEPVSAGPPSAAYRLRKFVRRNRVRVATGALVLASLVLGAAAATFGLVEARRQEQRALAVADARDRALRAEARQRQAAEEHRLRAEKRLAQVEKMNGLLGSIFEDLDPRKIERDGKPLGAVLGERLDRAAAEVEGEATGDPLAVARMQAILARSLLGLGHADRAVQLFTKARDTLASRLGPDDLATLATAGGLAHGYRDAGRLDQAVALGEEVLSRRQARLGPGHIETIRAMSDLAGIYHGAGRADRASEIFERSVALYREKLGPGHPTTIQEMHNLAATYAVTGRVDRAVPIFEEVLERQRASLGPDHPDTLTTLRNLAGGYYVTGQPSRSIRLLEEMVPLQRAKLGPDHPETLTSMNNLAASYGATGRYDRAVELLEHVLGLRTAKLGPDHPESLRSTADLAGHCGAAGQVGRAIKLYEGALPAMREKLGPGHPITVGSLEGYARCLVVAEQFDRAAVVLDELIASHRKARGDGHTDTLRARIARADLEAARGRLEAAEAAFRSALEACRAHIGPEHPLRLNAGLGLARVLERRGDSDRAAPLYREAIDAARQNPSDRVTLGRVLAESGRSSLEGADHPTAEARLREALEILGAERPQAWETAELRSLLGGALLGLGKVSEAAALLRSGYEGMAGRPGPRRTQLIEALDRLIAAGAKAGSKAEVAAWKSERARLGAEAAQAPRSEGR